jgi:hypothetical protein
MESKVKFAGHPVHPILIGFPLGLLRGERFFSRPTKPLDGVLAS